MQQMRTVRRIYQFVFRKKKSQELWISFDWISIETDKITKVSAVRED